MFLIPPGAALLVPNPSSTYILTRQILLANPLWVMWTGSHPRTLIDSYHVKIREPSQQQLDQAALPGHIAWAFVSLAALVIVSSCMSQCMRPTIIGSADSVHEQAFASNI